VQQAEQREQQDKVIEAQRARIEELTNKLLNDNTTTIAGVADGDESDGEDDEGDSDASEQKTNTHKRKHGCQKQRSRLLTTNPICSRNTCTRKVYDKIKSSGAYKKFCPTCLKNARNSKKRRRR
jgi:hypothetical protein